MRNYHTSFSFADKVQGTVSGHEQLESPELLSCSVSPGITDEQGSQPVTAQP